MANYTIPDSELDSFSDDIRKDFIYWRNIMYDRVNFNMADSIIHARSHCERVLLYSLIMGKELMPDDSRGRMALAIASVFHDTRRLDEYIDTGHGARAAAYYKQFTDANPDIPYIPEAAMSIRFHDLDDDLGIVSIESNLGDDVPRGLEVYSIFKDADALDRWRLGHRGLNPAFLRTEASRRLIDYAKNLVIKTMNPRIRLYIQRLVDETIDENNQ